MISDAYTSAGRTLYVSACVRVRYTSRMINHIIIYVLLVIARVPFRTRLRCPRSVHLKFWFTLKLILSNGDRVRRPYNSK